MTLLMTEVSHVGIIMCADSKITTFQNGKVISKDKKNWLKLLRVSKITAAVSYWGMIGMVTSVQFDTWLQKIISQQHLYNDLLSFAQLCANELNKACKFQALPSGNDVGLHIAGFHEWPDGVRRPTFYHVHNGHGRYLKKVDPTDPSFFNIVWDSDPRELFKVHHDFPDPSKSLDINLAVLYNGGWTTTNGDFVFYRLLYDHLHSASVDFSRIKNIRLPRDVNSLSSRLGLFKAMHESVLKISACSSGYQTIGGNVSFLAINDKCYLTS